MLGNSFDPGDKAKRDITSEEEAGIKALAELFESLLTEDIIKNGDFRSASSKPAIEAAGAFQDHLDKFYSGDPFAYAEVASDVHAEIVGKLETAVCLDECFFILYVELCLKKREEAISKIKFGTNTNG